MNASKPLQSTKGSQPSTNASITSQSISYQSAVLGGITNDTTLALGQSLAERSSCFKGPPNNSFIKHFVKLTCIQQIEHSNIQKPYQEVAEKAENKRA